MKTNFRPMLLVSLLLLVTGMGLLSGCSILGGGTTSELDNRITKLETDVQANGAAIAKLQQQVQAQQVKVDALTPAPAAPVTPPVVTPPAAPPVPEAPPKPIGLLPSASVVLDKLTITPAQANLGQTVTITIEVTNKGTVDGKYNVVLIEKPVPQVSSGIIEYANPVTLKAGETQIVTFTTSKTATGTYSVDVGTKTGQYSVIDPNAPPPS